VSVPVQLDPLVLGARQKLFDLPVAMYNADPFVPDYDVAADGRFLAVRREGDEKEEIHVVLNWVEEVRRALGR
jgi:hypothetical protein